MGIFEFSEPVYLEHNRNCSATPMMRSCNNVDLVKHNNQYYLAMRTAPIHFASKKVEMRIYSSYDTEYWTHEHTIKLGADVREPRFLSMNDTLFLYFFKGGTKLSGFEPDTMLYVEKQNNWSTPFPFGRRHFVPWRVRKHGNRAIMSTYNGENLYSNHTPGIQFLHSPDGEFWQPMHHGLLLQKEGIEEPEFIIHDDGTLEGIARREGWGGTRFHGHIDDIANIVAEDIPYKYDSALMHRFGNQTYLFARKCDTPVDKAPQILGKYRRQYNLAHYSLTKKRNALYKVGATLEHVMDLHGVGDTAFPALVHMQGDEYLFANYTSVKGDPSWFRGQFQTTRIYLQRMRISKHT